MTHRISCTDAKKMIGARLKHGFLARIFKPGKWNTVTFGVDDVRALLDQPGVVQVRVHRAWIDDKETLVLTGVQENGHSMLSAENFALDRGIECPPVCPTKPPTE